MAGPIKGRLSYVRGDYAFHFEPDQMPAEYSSIQVNSLQLALDEVGIVLYAYGYCPLVTYQETGLVPPVTEQKAALLAKMESPFVPGIAYTLGGPTAWPTWVNKKLGWVCLGQPSIKEPFQAVECATGVIAVICGSRLASVWLHPVALPPELLTPVPQG